MQNPRNAKSAKPVAPVVVETVHDKLAGPNTRRGTQRTLRSIREGAGAPARDIDYVREELGEMYVGYANQ